MNTIAKENEINAYLEEWLISRFSEWNSFYFDVMRNKKNGVYQLKDGEKICNLLNSIQGNLVLKTEDIHPPKTGISVHFSCSLP